MITTGLGFLAFTTFYTAAILLLAKKYPLKIYRVLPPILIIYLLTMVLYTCGAWTMTESVSAVKSALVNNMVPAMVFLMCLTCDVRRILKIGPKLILAFLTASLTICVGFVVSYLLFKGPLDAPYSEFGAVCASWVGGIQNFLAVKSALEVPDNIMSNVILMININYSAWIAILVAIGGLATKFNRWSKANVDEIHAISRKLDEDESAAAKTPTANSVLLVIGISLMATALCRLAASKMPTIAFVNASVWEYVFVSILGLALASTKLSKIAGIDLVSEIMLTMVMTLLATELNILQIADAWLWIVAGAVVLLVHALLYVPIARLFKFDLHTLGVASMANIGGPSSAPVVAATYHRSYVTISVIMGTFGCIIGTFVGLLLGQLLKAL